MTLPVPILKKKVPQGTRIGFVGPMAVGKTTYAEYLVNNYGYYRASLAAKLKAIAYEMFGVQGKDGDGRVILQGLGSDLRKYDKDVWIKYLLSNIRYKEGGNHRDLRVVVDDVRYLNEAELLKKNKFLIIKLETDPDILAERVSRLYPNQPLEAFQHASEVEQQQIVPDITLRSDFSADLIALDKLMTKFWSNG